MNLLTHHLVLHFVFPVLDAGHLGRRLVADNFKTRKRGVPVDMQWLGADIGILDVVLGLDGTGTVRDYEFEEVYVLERTLIYCDHSVCGHVQEGVRV